MKFLATLFLFLATSSFAGDTKTYDIQLDITLNGKFMGTQRIVTREGQMGAITQELGDEKSYIEVIPSKSKVRGRPGIALSFKFGIIQDDLEPEIVSSPQIITQPGTPFQFTLNEREYRLGRLLVVITASLRRAP